MEFSVEVSDIKLDVNQIFERSYSISIIVFMFFLDGITSVKSTLPISINELF